MHQPQFNHSHFTHFSIADKDGVVGASSSEQKCRGREDFGRTYSPEVAPFLRFIPGIIETNGLPLGVTARVSESGRVYVVHPCVDTPYEEEIVLSVAGQIAAAHVVNLGVIVTCDEGGELSMHTLNSEGAYDTSVIGRHPRCNLVRTNSVGTLVVSSSSQGTIAWRPDVHHHWRSIQLDSKGVFWKSRLQLHNDTVIVGASKAVESFKVMPDCTVEMSTVYMDRYAGDTLTCVSALPGGDVVVGFGEYYCAGEPAGGQRIRIFQPSDNGLQSPAWREKQIPISFPGRIRALCTLSDDLVVFGTDAFDDHPTLGYVANLDGEWKEFAIPLALPKVSDLTSDEDYGVQAPRSLYARNVQGMQSLGEKGFLVWYDDDRIITDVPHVVLRTTPLNAR